MLQRTFVMIKPDAVQRKLIGEIISTFERSNLSIVAMKMLKPSVEIVSKHYPDSKEWLTTVGDKTHKGYNELGLDVKQELGTDDRLEIGKMVKQWLVEYITSDSVVAMVLKGNAAVVNVRRLCGNTLPLLADPGSIRGRYSVDSPDIANSDKRPILNLIHASGDDKEAEFEINLWFPEL